MTTDTEARIQAAAQRAYDRNDIAATARRIAEIAKQIDARASHVTDRRSLNALHEAENTLAAILHAAEMRALETQERRACGHVNRNGHLAAAYTASTYAQKATVVCVLPLGHDCPHQDWGRHNRWFDQ